MSLIDDVVGKKLPTGRKFQAKVGTGNVAKKLYTATRRGVLSNLADNQNLLNKIANKRQAAIRSGKYNRVQRMADYREALKDKTLTKDDKKDIKAVLEHWGKGEVKTTKAPEIKKPSAAAKRAKAARASFRKPSVRELPDFLKKRGSVSVSDNPLSRQPYKAGSGGGIKAGLGGASGSAKPSTANFRKPRLLK